MIKILFVCHGNICRSPMAEFIMKQIVREMGLEDRIFCASAATSDEAIGGDVHPETQEQLARHGVPFNHRRAVRLRRRDYDEYDIIAVMDENNMNNIRSFFPDDPAGKICMLGEFSDGREIDDPWFTGEFDRAYDEISAGCEGLAEYASSFC